jgi:hypothetical protein
MKLWQKLKHPPWRTVVPGILLLILVPLTYVVWTPGKVVTDGRHDLGRNGIWLQHGWLGDDGWFERNQKTNRIPEFRTKERMQRLAGQLRQQHITDVFPHLCPAEITGEIAPVDAAQVERFLDVFEGFRVMPWVGGVLYLQVRPADAKWRKRFVGSIEQLLAAHPRLAGVQLNVEPMPSGNADFLVLLEEVRNVLPKGKVLSVAANPPPTRWHPFPDVHWQEPYFRAVAERSDQLAVMMYDTSLKRHKLYQHLMANWTEEVLAWAGGKPVLLGVPTYDDAGVEYHDPLVETLPNALLGIHRGLDRLKKENYQGVAVYCEWETDEAEWLYWQSHFLKAGQPR